MELLGIFTAFGLSASAGLNAYIPLLIVALLAKFTNLLTLKTPWDTLTSWWIIGIILFLALIEFFADKAPAVNHINDVVQTLIRPAAGAVAFAASANVVTEVHPVLSLALGLLIAGGVHTVKAAAVRPVVTATTAGAGNVPVSIAEDVVSALISFLAIVLPIVVACMLIILTSWLVFILYRRAKRASQNPAR
ncbi:MAG: DUF4126 domain-containing protein [Anaerolineaceae bacterium]|nr:DUF4126 domain-containing protein [Anaerolineaceae bacterium]